MAFVCATSTSHCLLCMDVEIITHLTRQKIWCVLALSPLCALRTNTQCPFRKFPSLAKKCCNVGFKITPRSFASLLFHTGLSAVMMVEMRSCVLFSHGVQVLHGAPCIIVLRRQDSEKREPVSETPGDQLLFCTGTLYLTAFGSSEFRRGRSNY